MVDSELRAGCAAVLAAVSVATEDVLARQHDILVRNSVISPEADNAGEWPVRGYAAELPAAVFFNKLCLVQKQQYDCLLDAADTDGLVALIKDEYASAYGSAGFRRFFEDVLLNV